MPFYLRLFTSLQFSTPRVDACINRALLLHTLATDVTRTFVNVTFRTMVLSAFEKLSLTGLIKKKKKRGECSRIRER